jgi:hypothetical protein
MVLGLKQNGTQKGRSPKDQVINPHMQTRANECQAKQFLVKALAGKYDKKRHVLPAERAAILTNRLDACFFPNGESMVRIVRYDRVIYKVMLNPNKGHK